MSERDARAPEDHDAPLEWRAPSKLPVGRARISWRLGTLGHAVVAHDAGDAQAIVAEHALAAALLRRTVVLDVAPRRDRRFVAPERERQELGVVGQALEPLDAEEPVDVLQLGLQLGGDVEIGLLVAVGRPDFEDDGDHGFSPFSARPHLMPGRWALSRDRQFGAGRSSHAGDRICFSSSRARTGAPSFGWRSRDEAFASVD